MTPGSKFKFRILTAELQEISNHILEYQLFTAENVGEVQATNLTERRKRRFSALIDPLEQHENFETLSHIFKTCPIIF